MKAMKLVLAALMLMAGTVFAQAPVDAEQKAAVKELLDAMNFKQMMSQMGVVMTQQMPQMFDQVIDGFAGKGKLTPEQKDEARKIALQSEAVVHG